MVAAGIVTDVKLRAARIAPRGPRFTATASRRTPSAPCPLHLASRRLRRAYSTGLHASRLLHRASFTLPHRGNPPETDSKPLARLR